MKAHLKLGGRIYLVTWVPACATCGRAHVLTGISFPGADASRAEIDAWRAAHIPPPAAEEPQHEAPPIANGPSLMCNACGEVRINIFNGPFCKSCAETIGLAAGPR